MMKMTSFGIVSRGISSRWDAALKTRRILFITFFFLIFSFLVLYGNYIIS